MECLRVYVKKRKSFFVLSPLVVVEMGPYDQLISRTHIDDHEMYTFPCIEAMQQKRKEIRTVNYAIKEQSTRRLVQYEAEKNAFPGPCILLSPP